ncbi:hypothetical protein [Thalassotalea sp. SU-HH00458]|uniref:hypothetical protein n=1 Tax=Thalassotalea sp. SU-HH00458 TaxID=3127657 RepID=UPI003104C388
MSLSSAKLFVYNFVIVSMSVSVLLYSHKVLPYSNFSTCTADINKYGFSSYCSCNKDHRYELKTGKCVLLTPSQKLKGLQNLLVKTELEISSLQSLDGEESKKTAIDRLPKYLTGIAEFMENLNEHYQFPPLLIKKARHAANLATFDIEYCSNDKVCECTELLEQLKVTILKIKNTLNSQDLDNINHKDSSEVNEESQLP